MHSLFPNCYVLSSGDKLSPGRGDGKEEDSGGEEADEDKHEEDYDHEAEETNKDEENRENKERGNENNNNDKISSLSRTSGVSRSIQFRR